VYVQKYSCNCKIWLYAPIGENCILIIYLHTQKLLSADESVFTYNLCIWMLMFHILWKDFERRRKIKIQTYIM
jgi:hypothetical protein